MRSASAAGLGLLGMLLLSGCQQQMANQPSYKPLHPSTFFPDGRSARPLVPGTVARGNLRTDVAYFTGRKSRAAGQLRLQPAAMTSEAATARVRTIKETEPAGETAPALAPRIQPQQPDPQAYDPNVEDDFVDAFPIPMTEEVLQHGRNRYMIYCALCHDPLGTGHGKIVERGYAQPPSYHIERLRKARVGHLFAVVSEGYGSMPAYAAQIPVRDRWAIVGYLRALQASQHFDAARLSPAMRAERAHQPPAPAPGGTP